LTLARRAQHGVDLSPLEGTIALHTHVLDGTPVTNLSSLKNLPLQSLRIRGTKVSDLTPLKGMPLKEIWLDDPARTPRCCASSSGSIGSTANRPPIPGLPAKNNRPAKKTSEFWRKSPPRFALKKPRGHGGGISRR